MKASAAIIALLLGLSLAARADPTVSIVAAENFYGGVAGQIGSPAVQVTSILSNPADDPHLFEASPSVARAVAAAGIVIYNGADYDPWMKKLLQTAGSRDRTVIVVGDLIGRKPGDNPHIWYDPASMLALAGALAKALGDDDPAHRADYEQRRARFAASLKPIQARIAALRERLAGTPVTATEPVFGDMFAALGMQDRNRSFQLAVMNNTEPSASDVIAFENDLKTRAVKLLVYNSQATDPIAKRMAALAEKSHVPVLGVTETEPAGTDYQHWMMDVLNGVAAALPTRTP